MAHRHEARQMQMAAQKFKAVTQRCNQIQSHSAYRTALHWVHSGLLGKVKEVFSWQAGAPTRPRNIPRPTGSDPVPAQVRWDLWQGVAPERAYKVARTIPSIGAAGRPTALGNWAILAATFWTQSSNR